MLTESLVVLAYLCVGILASILYELDYYMNFFAHFRKPILFVTDLLLSVIVGGLILLCAVELTQGKLHIYQLASFGIGLIISHNLLLHLRPKAERGITRIKRTKLYHKITK